MTGPITWGHLAGFLAGVAIYLLVRAIREARGARRAAEVRQRARELAAELALAYAEQRARERAAGSAIFYDDPPQVAETDKGQDEA